MRYLSTRGGMSPRTFTEILLTGLAPDGGLAMPEAIRKSARQRLNPGDHSTTRHLRSKFCRVSWMTSLPTICAH